jgi:hypothetical protein
MLMLRSVISRFRTVVLLVFVLGLTGQALANVAMAAQMQPAISLSMTSPGAPCPGCDDDGQPGMAAGCTVAVCWTVPALPAQATVIGSVQGLATFAVPPDAFIAGIVAAPDPYPPRSFLHT